MLLTVSAVQGDILNLTTQTIAGDPAPATSGTINGAKLLQTGTQPTGTGKIDSFERIGRASADHVQGNNTDDRSCKADGVTLGGNKPQFAQRHALAVSNNDGYEEWAKLGGGGGTNEAVPLPGVALAGMLLMGGTLVRRSGRTNV